MEKVNKIYEGKGKILYATDSPDYLIQYFKDDTTAFNAAKKGIIKEKGIMNNGISTKMFEFLETEGIPTHFHKKLNAREMAIKKVDIIPIEIVIRNKAAGSLCRNLGLEEGQHLSSAILEFCYKRDDLNDPLINEYHIEALSLASRQEVAIIKRYAFQINELMIKFFLNLDLDLIDFKLEFGHYKNSILLADEISPDTCRLWEVGTGRKLDKDRFRHDLENIEEAYQEILKRVSV